MSPRHLQEFNDVRDLSQLGISHVPHHLYAQIFIWLFRQVERNPQGEAGASCVTEDMLRNNKAALHALLESFGAQVASPKEHKPYEAHRTLCDDPDKWFHDAIT